MLPALAFEDVAVKVVGKTLSHYEIVAPLGTGGMGEVYRARDTKLDRDVAIKVLPEDLAADRDRLARFEREAKLLAALSHANIGAIHGLEESVGVNFLVLELIEGESLERRLQRGAIPVPEALDISLQIAGALEAAHDAGIVHRDVKPANVLLTAKGGVKVLDFGIAKRTMLDGVADVAITEQATSLTVDGTLMGTPPYMAPEQIRGEEADRRADIWSFGCVVYEMLTGRAAFARETVADTLVAVLEAEPDWRALPTDAPNGTSALLRRCLRKTRSRRLRDVADAGIEIADIIEQQGQAEVSAPTDVDSAGYGRANRLVWALLVVIAMLAVAVAVSWFLRPSPLSTPVTLSISVPPSHELSRFRPAISPEGTRIVFGVTGPDRIGQLWLRDLGELEPRPLGGTEEGYLPFWSPNGRELGFFTDGQLMVLDLGSGTTRLLVETERSGRGGTWNQSGDILYALEGIPGLLRVSSADGLASPVFDGGGFRDQHPQFLPDGRRFVFHRSLTDGSGTVALSSLDDPTIHTVISSATDARYMAPGYLLFRRGEELLVQTIDLESATLTGDPTVFAQGIGGGVAGAGPMDAAPGGIIAHRAPDSYSQVSLKWFDVAGTDLGLALPQGDYRVPVLSPTGDRVAVDRLDPESGLNVWVVDLDTEVSTRLTTDGGAVPVWSPQGDRIAFARERGDGGRDLYVVSSNAPDTEELLYESPAFNTPTHWSPDGRYLMFTSDRDVMAIEVEGDADPIAVAATDARETSGHFSPTGEWVAYRSSRTGVSQIYIKAFPPVDTEFPITAGGGEWPVWRADGREIYFFDPFDDSIKAVPVEIDGAVVSPGTVRTLFPVAIGGIRPSRNYFDAVGGAGRFLVLAPGDSGGLSGRSLTVWVNALEVLGGR